jgi:S-DNA-T family DNA segregation ATPase FtsK/SpoIIIE
MLGGLGSIVVVATMGSPTGGGQARSLLPAGVLVVATLALVVLQLDGQRQRHARDVADARTAYLRYLRTVRERVLVAAAQQRRASLWKHPHPNALPMVVEEGSRVWACAVTDPHFRHVRYAVAERPLSLELVPPGDGQADRPDHVDPAAATALNRLIAVHRVQPDLPATFDLAEVDAIEVCGPPDWRRSVAGALVCSAAVGQSPAHLTVAVLASEESLAEWDWVKWLPHARSDRLTDAVGPRRLVSARPDELASLLPAGRRLLLVVDGAGFLPECPSETTVLDLTGRPRDCHDARRVRLISDDATGIDECDLATAEAVARRLTRHQTRFGKTTEGSGQRSSRPDLTDLLGLGDIHVYDAPTAWRARAPLELLRVPIGLDETGAVVELDLKEAAQHGMGPHGLVIGATGSGKSELLRTIVLGLALTHSPEQLNFVLVDFKGGATFAGMSAMPHVSALITNLADELVLVDRMQDALTGEMVRRQELLRDTGNHASVRDYERARAAGARLDPLPSLLVVVDEFAELLSARPEFLDLFMAIGRLGRSLGLHLLLGSQRLEEGRLRGLESHLSYRIGLRTFSAHESRALLGVPDAYELPLDPGSGFLKSGQATPVRFGAAYVSGPVSVPAPAGSAEQPAILPWTVAEVAPPKPREPPDATIDAASLLDVAVSRMSGRGPRAHRVWLPPLDVPDTLDALMPDLATDPDLGLVSHEWRGRGRLTVPLGVVDRPREQRRDVLTADLSGANGHVVVVGGPRTGKSTLLRTLVAALALTTTPLETQIYVLDFGGGAFAAMRSLPHLAGLASRAEPDVVRRIVAEVLGIVDRRETCGSVRDAYGDVFLVVDGWGTLRSDFDDLEPDLQRLASRGLAFGCHVLSASSRWADYRTGIRDLLGTRLELRLGDPLDSEADRRLAAQVPASSPGRGLVRDGLHFLAALPRIDGDSRSGSLDDGVESLVDQIARAWRGPAGPRLRLLPEQVTVDDLLERADEPTRASGVLLLGLDEKALAPVGLDPDREPHWLVFGDSGSGKSAALRTYLHEVIRTRTPERAQLAVVDYRRSLLGEVPEAYLAHYLTSAAEAASALDGLASYLADKRLPGPDVTPAQLRDRSWWRGAELYVVVDDYDLVATSSGSPLQSLLPLLAQARDVGLHLAVARRSGGASRALFEPVLQTLRDLASPGLVLSGSPEEGALVGNVRPRPSPPGRGRLITRDSGVDVVQLAWREPAAP